MGIEPVTANSLGLRPFWDYHYCPKEELNRKNIERPIRWDGGSGTGASRTKVVAFLAALSSKVCE